MSTYAALSALAGSPDKLTATQARAYLSLNGSFAPCSHYGSTASGMKPQTSQARNGLVADAWAHALRSGRTKAFRLTHAVSTINAERGRGSHYSLRSLEADSCDPQELHGLREEFGFGDDVPDSACIAPTMSPSNSSMGYVPTNSGSVATAIPRSLPSSAVLPAASEEDKTFELPGGGVALPSESRVG